MTSENDLVLAIRDTLDTDGTLGRFKAEMRTKIINILNGQESFEKPHLSNETLLLNELIREYLTWNGYKYAKAVFVQGICKMMGPLKNGSGFPVLSPPNFSVTESGLTNEPIPRHKVLQDLGVEDSEDSSKFPVLHGIIAAFKDFTRKEA